MLLAPRFTYIHEPKTGGTFVNHVVGHLHGRLIDLTEWRLRRPALRLGFPAASYYPELLSDAAAGTPYGRESVRHVQRDPHRAPLAHDPRDRVPVST